MYHVPLAVQCIYGWSNEGGEDEEDLRVMVGQFAEVCRKKELIVNAGKSKVMVLNERRD